MIESLNAAPSPGPEESLSRKEIAALRSRAQLLDPILKVGRAGVSPGFIASLNQALADHDLVKIKFADFKEERRELSRQLARETLSHWVGSVGHVAIFYRPRPRIVAAETAHQKNVPA